MSASLRGMAKPAGLRKSWEHNSMTRDSTGEMLRGNYVPADWGDPVDAEAWFTTRGAVRVCRAIYANGRIATLRCTRDGKTTTFGSAQ